VSYDRAIITKIGPNGQEAELCREARLMRAFGGDVQLYFFVDDPKPPGRLRDGLRAI
jgi:hypothetical protein